VFAFVESRLFTRLVYEYLSEDDYFKLQQALVENPEAGELIQGSGGLRKLRWALSGRGKRGGLRVIYYVRMQPGVIWMLTLYAKNVADNIPAHVLRKIRQEMEDV
jgi:mRNA-degrading endonuclease RelE of RelBE toxin-antitoxin system